VRRAAASPHAAVREAAARIAATWPEGAADDHPAEGDPTGGTSASVAALAVEIADRLVDDTDPFVRLAATVAAAMRDGAAAGDVLAKAAAAAPFDPWIGRAIVAGAQGRAAPVLAAVAAAAATPPLQADPALREPDADVAALHAERIAFVERLGTTAAGGATTTNAAGTPGDAAPLAADAAAALAAVSARARDSVTDWFDVALLVGLAARRPLDAIAAAGHDAAAACDAARAAAGKIAVDRDQPLADRRLAVRLLGQAARGTGAGGGAARAVLDAFIGAHEPAELQAEAVAAVVRSGVAESIAGVVAALSSLEPAVRAAAVTALLDRRDATPALLAAIERREVSPAIVPLERRAALEKSFAEAIRAAAARIWPAGTAGLSAAELESLVAAVRRGGSVDRGREVFTRHCAACHQVAGAGRQVGPDLAEAADRPIERLVSDIVDPNRSVEPRWEATLIVTTTGDPLEGILVASGRESVVLVRAGGDRITVPREDIEALRAGGRSLMPEGFGRQVPPGDFADLVAFLRGGRPVPVLVRK